MTFPTDTESLIDRLDSHASIEQDIEYRPEESTLWHSQRGMIMRAWMPPLLVAVCRLTYILFLPLFVPGMMYACYLSFQDEFGVRSFVLSILTLKCIADLARDDMFLRGCCGYRTRVREGVYYKKTSRNEDIIQSTPFLREGRTYSPTPYLYNGNIKTMYPFVSFKNETMKYQRRALRTEDGQAIVLDWAFPETGYNPNKPVVIYLHGLNGGSQSLYVVQAAKAAIARGNTVVVMVGRGLMQTAVKDGMLFNGSRTSDAESVFLTIREIVGPTVHLMAAGFSMGGIILANTIAQMGAKCPLDAAVTVAGCLDLVKNNDNPYSQFYWQPFLCFELKRNILKPFLHYLHDSDVDTDAVHRCWTVSEFDERMVVPYFGYDDLDHYYRDMSAYCDNKLDNLSIPFLVLHAEDDPFIQVDTMPVEECATNENLFFCITASGGHVGWSEGFFPAENGWEFMNTVTLDWCDGIATVNANQSSPTSSLSCSPTSSSPSPSPLLSTSRSRVVKRSHVRATSMDAEGKHAVTNTNTNVDADVDADTNAAGVGVGVGAGAGVDNDNECEGPPLPRPSPPTPIRSYAQRQTQKQAQHQAQTPDSTHLASFANCFEGGADTGAGVVSMSGPEEMLLRMMGDTHSSSKKTV